MQIQTIQNSILFKQTKINPFKHKQNQQIPIDFEYQYKKKQINYKTLQAQRSGADKPGNYLPYLLNCKK